ncbi:Hypothetical_protein [Hexamita inflata]|uniref:Hypothetical_protein n=1 Tax=Hexamita inflata TaxID=28002 RepID=A0AA86QK72_9EUKA|nr:Hypothetical protein HINF_LOCUS47810 [Hexamita inflata]
MHHENAYVYLSRFGHKILDPKKPRRFRQQSKYFFKFLRVVQMSDRTTLESQVQKIVRFWLIQIFHTRLRTQKHGEGSRTTLILVLQVPESVGSFWNSRAAIYILPTDLCSVLYTQAISNAALYSRHTGSETSNE